MVSIDYDHPVLVAVGALVVCWYTLRLFLSLLRGIKVYILSRPLGLATDLRKLGDWAVVTGSTDGIGKAYAEQLAENGINIVLISRNLDKLKNVAQEIESGYAVKTKVVQVDFTGRADIYTNISQALKGLDIGVLVNNVGTSYGRPKYFSNFPNQFLPDIINVNLLSCTMMTKIVLPQMVKKRKGAIINISSGSAFKPLPLVIVYSATKAYMDFFSRGLHEEYACRGIIVQSVLPCFVTTKLSGMVNANLFIPTPRTYVRSALQTVGLKSRTTGYLAHALQAYGMELVPEWIYGKVVLAVAGGFHGHFRNASKKQH